MVYDSGWKSQTEWCCQLVKTTGCISVARKQTGKQLLAEDVKDGVEALSVPTCSLEN